MSHLGMDLSSAYQSHDMSGNSASSFDFNQPSFPLENQQQSQHQQSLSTPIIHAASTPIVQLQSQQQPHQLPHQLPIQQPEMYQQSQQQQQQQQHQQHQQSRQQQHQQLHSWTREPQGGMFDSFWSKKRDVMKLIQWSLVVLLGLSLHFAFKYGIKRYIKDNDLSYNKEYMIKCFYPLGVILVMWTLKAFGR
jgi:hypothetical protein